LVLRAPTEDDKEPIVPYPQIPARELAEMLESDPRVRVVDVRTGGEFESGHIPGAYNVPLDALSEHQRDLVDLGEPVVLVCQSGARACRAEEALADAGMGNVRVLVGGMNAWRAEGREVLTIRERWPLDRQVRLVAGSIVAASILASARFPRAKWIAGGVGAGLTGAALANSCAMGALLARLPYNRPIACDTRSTIERMRRHESQQVAA
jgi:rhodanese-related sulfurtransferase